MKRCKTCKHYDSHVIHFHLAPGTGLCERIVYVGGEKAEIICDVGVLKVTDDFGCVLHEPKKERQ